MKKNRLGKFLVILGAVLLLASLSLVLWNNYESLRAENAANAVLSKLLDKMPETVKSSDAEAKRLMNMFQRMNLMFRQLKLTGIFT